jgi:hypothetical protein
VAAGPAPLLLSRAGEEEDGKAGLDLVGRQHRRPKRLALEKEQGQARLVVDRDPLDAARPSVHSGDLGLGRAEHEIVRGEHAVGTDRDSRAHARFAEDGGRRVLARDLGAQEDQRRGGGAGDGDQRVHGLGRL